MGIEILPCCVSCKIGYVPLKNDIVVLETMDKEAIEPYKLWSADLVECPKCNNRIIIGFGRSCMAEHYEEGFDAVLSKCFTEGILFTISGTRLAMNNWDGVTN